MYVYYVYLHYTCISYIIFYVHRLDELKKEFVSKKKKLFENHAKFEKLAYYIAYNIPYVRSSLI